MKQEKSSDAASRAYEVKSDAAVWVELSKLVPWVKNPRKNDPAVPGIVRSIIRWGFGNPLLVRTENGEVIAGHTRIKAVRQLKRDWSAASSETRSKWHPEAVLIAETLDPLLPVRYRDLSEKEAHLLALADNKTGELAEWDDAAVEKALRDCSLSDITDAGWTGDDLEKLTDSILGIDGKSPKAVKLDETYQVVIECNGEDEQVEVIEWAQSKGIKCRALI
jgi:hypothetical protein